MRGARGLAVWAAAIMLAAGWGEAKEGQPAKTEVVVIATQHFITDLVRESTAAASIEVE